MADSNILADVISKYGQNVHGMDPSFLNDPRAAASFMSSIANGTGDGANMNQSQLDEARYYQMKLAQQTGGPMSNGQEDAGWLGMAGKDGYGYTKDSVLERARQNMFVNGQTNPNDIGILDQFNQGPKAWAEQGSGSGFNNLLDKYGSSQQIRDIGAKMGFTRDDPFAGQMMTDGAGNLRSDAVEYMKSHPGWQPRDTYKGPAPASPGLGDFQNGYAMDAWRANNPNATQQQYDNAMYGPGTKQYQAQQAGQQWQQVQANRESYAAPSAQQQGQGYQAPVQSNPTSTATVQGQGQNPAAPQHPAGNPAKIIDYNTGMASFNPSQLTGPTAQQQQQRTNGYAARYDTASLDTANASKRQLGF